MKKTLKMISKLASKEAKKNAHSTCWGGWFQMKEPKEITKLKTK